MSKNFLKISINNSNFLHSDIAIVDRYVSELVFTSMIGQDTLLKNIAKSIKKKTNCLIERKANCITNGEYEVEKERPSGADFSHMIIKKKDKVEDIENNTLYNFYMIFRNMEELIEIFFDKLNKNTPVPILKEWTPYLIEEFRNRRLFQSLTVYKIDDENTIEAYKANFTLTELQNIVQEAIRNNDISINEGNKTSEIMNEVTGLDMYLNIYGDILANKIQTAFKPKFVPGESTYDEYVHNYDDSCFYGGINIYEAQKTVIQACVNNLNKNKATVVVGEMGVGGLLCA